MAIAVRKFDAIVVGAGGSGMRAALELARRGPAASRCSPRCSRRARTRWPRRAASPRRSATSSEDNWHWHMYDTVKGSDYLGDQDAIEYMCRTANEVVVELEHYRHAVRPARRTARSTSARSAATRATTARGRCKRSCAAADRTGHAMLHTLYQRNVRAQHAVLRRVDGARPDPRSQDGDVLGVTALEMETGEVMILQAKATLLRHRRRRAASSAASTNAFINTGDGLGMAARAGIPLEDMEFWQFHPTGVAGAGVLITEGVRGEGGFLLNKNGERFMERYAPNAEGPREPRRGVARDGHRDQGRPRLRRGRRLHAAQARPPRPRGDQQAPARHPRDRDQVRQRRPGHASRSRWCRRCHYQMGGIPTNYHGPGGRARTATAARSIVRGLLRGRRVRLRLGARRQPPRHQLAARPAGVRQGRGRADDQGHRSAAAGRTATCRRTPASARARASRGSTRRRRASACARCGADLRRTMQAHCGVFRFPDDLLPRACEKIKEIAERAQRTFIKDKSQGLQHRARRGARARQPGRDRAGDDRSRPRRARKAAARRTRATSRSATTRTGCKHTLWYKEGDRLDYKPVNLKPLTVEAFEPKVDGSY